MLKTLVSLYYLKHLCVKVLKGFLTLTYFGFYPGREVNGKVKSYNVTFGSLHLVHQPQNILFTLKRILVKLRKLLQCERVFGFFQELSVSYSLNKSSGHCMPLTPLKLACLSLQLHFPHDVPIGEEGPFLFRGICFLHLINYYYDSQSIF